MFCPNCGNKMEEGAGFCSKCGWEKNAIKRCVRNLKLNEIIKTCTDNIKNYANKFKVKFLELDIRKRVISIVSIIFVVILFIILKNTAFATKNVIKRDNAGKYYLNAEGKRVINNWFTYKGNQYHANESGYIDTNKWIYANYYVDSNGILLKNQWINDENGEKKYYVGDTGRYLANTLMTIDGKDYYFKDDGIFVTNTLFVIPGNSWTSYFNEDGELVKVGDFINIDGNVIYIDTNGKIVSNEWVEKNGKWYYLDKSGKVVTNQWIDNTYYVDGHGVMLKNTKSPEGYEIDKDGKVLEQYKIYLLGDDLSTMIANSKCVIEYSDDTTIDQMDTVTFGLYPQSDASGKKKEPIEWIVLDKQGDKALLLSKYILDCKCYNDTKQKYNYWKNCTLENWLNTTFLNNVFDSSEQTLIEITDISYIGHFGIPAIEPSQDKIFCLSVEELSNMSLYRKKIATKGTNYAKTAKNGESNLFVYNGYDSYYFDDWCVGNSAFWINDPLQSEDDTVHVVRWDGSYGDVAHNNNLKEKADGTTIGVRPAIWVNYSGATNALIGTKVAYQNSSMIVGMPTTEATFRDGYYYVGNDIQKNSWVYYTRYYYHVDDNGNVEKNKWIENRYVGDDGRLYRGRMTPDGKYVGINGLVVDATKDLSDSILVEEVKGDAWYKTKSGLWYYFENDRKTTKKGWFTDYRDNQTYYLDPKTGIMVVGLTTIDGKQYYFNESYDNEPNWYEVGDGIYESYGKKVMAYGSMFRSETIPDGSYADENGVVSTGNKSSENSGNVSDVGNKMSFGSYPMSDASGATNESIEWIVIDKDEANNKILLLSSQIIDCKKYNETRDKVTWETCTLRKWLNNDFYNKAFSSEEKNKIITTNVINKDNPYKESVKGGNSTNDKIFLLSVEEVNKYFSQADMKSENSKLATFATNYAKNVDNAGEKLWINYEKGAMYDGYSYYWLRSPGIYQRDAAGVDYDGKLDNDGRYVDVAVIGVRPAMWVSY